MICSTLVQIFLCSSLYTIAVQTVNYQLLCKVIDLKIVVVFGCFPFLYLDLKYADISYLVPCLDV